MNANVSRRAVAKGIAWTVPVITCAGAAPALAASPLLGCARPEIRGPSMLLGAELREDVGFSNAVSAGGAVDLAPRAGESFFIRVCAESGFGPPANTVEVRIEPMRPEYTAMATLTAGEYHTTYTLARNECQTWVFTANEDFASDDLWGVYLFHPASQQGGGNNPVTLYTGIDRPDCTDSCRQYFGGSWQNCL
ncbi:MAG: hypothetical protein Q4P36_02170 [Bowdeniella nasicola]|nr:hypothetical protein [Bowdeniella nasicola]